MTHKEIYELVKAKFPDTIIEFVEEGIEPLLKVKPEAINKISRYLKDAPEALFDGLMCLSGVDARETLDVAYHLCSYELKHRFAIKVSVPVDDPVVPSVDDVWPTANWHEREAFDLVGIKFDKSSDLRRILLPPDWEGHPLRKDYIYPETYQEFKLERGEEGWADPVKSVNSPVKPKPEKPDGSDDAGSGKQ